MKKKVGELYDKPIVIGNPNEFTKDELPLNELKQGKNQYLYFSVNYSNEEELDALTRWRGFNMLICGNYCSLLKCYDLEENSVVYQPFIENPNILYAASLKLLGICIDPQAKADLNLTKLEQVNLTLQEDGIQSIYDMPGVTPITEEEFFTI
jgi:hypothetical protein